MATWDGRNSYWTGDEWRWGLGAPRSNPTIHVIEPAIGIQPAKPKATHPFGFSVERLEEDSWPDAPLLWEGDQA